MQAKEVGSRDTALLIPNRGTRWGRGGCKSSTPRPGRIYPWERWPVPIAQVAGMAQGSIWMCAKNLAPAWVRLPNSPAPNVVAIPTMLPSPSHLQKLLPNVFFPLEISNTT